jgi:hypothetical protein
MVPRCHLPTKVGKNRPLIAENDENLLVIKTKRTDLRQSLLFNHCLSSPVASIILAVFRFTTVFRS